MTDIDPNTGLPQLSDTELFFRVTESGVLLMRRLPDTMWEEEWQRYSDHEATSSSYEYRDVLFTEQKKTWWGGKREEVKTKREFRYVKRATTVAKARTEQTGSRTEYNGYTRAPYEVPTYASITKEDILPLAEKALATYNAHLAHKSLLGDYPPKSL